MTLSTKMLEIHLGKNNPENLCPISVSSPLSILCVGVPKTSRNKCTVSLSITPTRRTHNQ